MSQLSAIALSLLSAGYSVIPIQQSSKKPAVHAWLPYQSMPMDSRTAEKEFLDNRQIAVITGSISGNLELIDFDTNDEDKCPHFNQWWLMLKENGYEELLRSLTVAKTPSGGYHVFYKCPEGVDSNQPLAKTEITKPPLIETRGEGGYALIAPSPGYVWRQGNLDSVPKISLADRDVLMHAATMFDEVPAKVEPPPRKAPRMDGINYVGEEEPWAVYNRQTDIKDLLEREGWTYVGMIGKREKWRRPGKDKGEHSGTLTTIGDQVFYPFTTSTVFPEQKGLDAFGVYTWLKHYGDFSKATIEARKELGMDVWKPVSRPGGYESPRNKPVELGAKSPTGNGFAAKTVDDFEIENPVFGIFGKYLLCGTINLLEARGEVGKTTLILKWIADASNGFDTYHDFEMDPYRALIFTTEDKGGDIKATYNDLNGKPGYLDIYEEPVDMRGGNIEMLEATIRENNYKLVVFDPLLTYMHGVSNINDPRAVNEYLVPLRMVAMRTGACILNIRHFAQNTLGKDRSQYASGTAQFRDSHRSQIVMSYHKDIERKGLRVCTQERASIRTMKQPPFGWERTKYGFQWFYDEKILEQGI